MPIVEQGLDLLRKFEEAEKSKVRDQLVYEQRKLELGRFVRTIVAGKPERVGRIAG